MDNSGTLGSARPPKRARLSLQDFKCTPKIHHQDAASYQQIDGSGDYYQQGCTHEARPSIIQPSLPHTHSQSQPIRPQHHQAVTQVSSRPPYRKPESAVTDILPYCTTEPPLKQEQVIALSDVVGSVGELVLLALSAASGDRECAEVMESAVGAATASSIVDFFTEEWEVE